MLRTFGARDWEMLPTPASRPGLPKCRAFGACGESGWLTRSHQEAMMMKNEARSAATRVDPRVSAG
jgi:hypothetical protein